MKSLVGSRKRAWRAEQEQERERKGTCSSCHLQYSRVTAGTQGRCPRHGKAQLCLSNSPETIYKTELVAPLGFQDSRLISVLFKKNRLSLSIPRAGTTCSAPPAAANGTEKDRGGLGVQGLGQE